MLRKHQIYYQLQLHTNDKQNHRFYYQTGTGMDSTFVAATPPISPVAPSPSELTKCPTCGRKFNPTAYEKHVKICEKVFMKKRKAFNASAKRVDTERNGKHSHTIYTVDHGSHSLYCYILTEMSHMRM